MAHRFEPNDCEETRHGYGREDGRGYTIIGWIVSGANPSLRWPVLIPDELRPDEPATVRVERTRPMPTIIPDGM